MDRIETTARNGLPIIDAHQHFWDPARNYHPWLRDQPPIPFRYGDYSAIRRRFLPPDYFALTRRWNVTQTVYVETEWDPADPVGETRYIHAVAAEHGFPNAVVAQAWLDREDASEVLAAQAAFPLVRSVRHKPKSADGPDSVRRGRKGGLDDPRWRDGYALLARHGLMFDLQAPWWELEAAADLAADFPATQIILNHAGLPADRSAGGLFAWRRAMDRLARHGNVKVKISGMGAIDPDWRIEQNIPIIREIIHIFGYNRSMFASNFPVDNLVASFDQIYECFLKAASSLDDVATSALLHDTALRLYRPQALDDARLTQQTQGELT